ncbi:general secretion pathway protein D [Cupriavidus metallidurans]|jgi:general secretion pathway protein D|uniref:Secretion type II protein gspD(Secretin)-like protein n=1 Tax=Cupriavidus metallidurans (strain ATCC 43123 / DSM 2839 / NBRC 102507 / CH34) TaxID=266264 RepID=Q1LE58_CUPMC|nr:Putative secretion type II protein; gspD(secretin)-like protein [Cupriavidus metallidurans CH34]KWW32767.1 Type II secretion system protein D [Cupriavidus metallidurans]QGS31400.1 general secretion pathway protein GspD [Cupriavidus metallidurans]
MHTSRGPRLIRARCKAQPICIGVILLGTCLAGCSPMYQRFPPDPSTNAEQIVGALRERDRQVNALLEEAERLRAAGQYQDAVPLLGAANQLDPTNERARILGAALQRDWRDAAILQEAERMFDRGSYDIAAERVRYVLAENPNSIAGRQLAQRIEEQRRLLRLAREEQRAAGSIMRTPVTLQFRDANIRMVFEALSRTSGLNVIFDRDVRADLKTTIFVTNAAIEDAVDLILLQSQLDKKVLNANTLFIYPATPAKQQEYQELKVRTFQLSNVDSKQVQSLLKSLLKIKEVVVDERANTVTIRGTPDTIRVAEQMIAAQDLPEPEVMLEVQVLEVSRERLTDLGIAWPNSFTMATPASATTWGVLHHLTANELEVSPLSATANFKLTDTDANLLASPRIRTRNKEKARILIGDKVPVISSSSTPSTSGPSFTQTIQYLDVGIKLEVEPQVYRDNDVGIKLALEVSNITKTIQSGNAQTGLSSLAYQIGTRSASTSLRLRDGETQILGGLISDQDRTSADKVPGLGQLPVVGRLFSDHNGDHVKTEIVLQITPHIVRPQLTMDSDTRELWSGTDTNVRTEQLRLDPSRPVASTASGAPALPYTPVKPGQVGGGTMGPPPAASGSAAATPKSAFGQPPPPMRTTPPPAPYNGRFSGTPAVPQGQAAPAGTAEPAPPPPVPASGNADGSAENTAPPPAPRGPVQVELIPPTPPAPMPRQPTDIPSDNPLYSIPGGSP